MRHFWPLLAVLVFHGADGGRVWIIDSQVAGVIEFKGVVGSAPTAIMTTGGTFYVKERPEDVAKKLGWIDK